MATASTDKRIKVMTTLIGVIGAIMLVAGVGTWFVVQSQLAAENITVADDADFLAGDEVNGPFSAYAQADIIAEHAEGIADGKTYAELPQDDPRRTAVMDASFLRASLYTSVVAFGVAFMAGVLGIILMMIAWVLRAGLVAPDADERVSPAT